MATVNTAETRSAAIADLYAGRSVKQVCRKYDLTIQAINAWKRFGYYRPNGNETADKAYTNGNGNGVKGAAPKLTVMDRLTALEKRMDETYFASFEARQTADIIAKEIGLEN